MSKIPDKMPVKIWGLNRKEVNEYLNNLEEENYRKIRELTQALDEAANEKSRLQSVFEAVQMEWDSEDKQLDVLNEAMKRIEATARQITLTAFEEAAEILHKSKSLEVIYEAKIAQMRNQISETKKQVDDLLQNLLGVLHNRIETENEDREEKEIISIPAPVEKFVPYIVKNISPPETEGAVREKDKKEEITENLNAEQNKEEIIEDIENIDEEETVEALYKEETTEEPCEEEIMEELHKEEIIEDIAEEETVEALCKEEITEGPCEEEIVEELHEEEVAEDIAEEETVEVLYKEGITEEPCEEEIMEDFHEEEVAVDIAEEETVEALYEEGITEGPCEEEIVERTSEKEVSFWGNLDECVMEKSSLDFLPQEETRLQEDLKEDAADKDRKPEEFSAANALEDISGSYWGIGGQSAETRSVNIKQEEQGLAAKNIETPSEETGPEREIPQKEEEAKADKTEFDSGIKPEIQSRQKSQAMEEEINWLRSKYIVGKIAGEQLLGGDGRVIIAKNEVITAEVVQIAEHEGKLPELIINMLLPGLEN